MLTRVQKWGNSQGARIPVQLLKAAQIAIGDEVEVRLEAGCIVLEPSRRIRGRYRLEDLVAQMPEDYVAQEEDWGESVGREAW